MLIHSTTNRNLLALVALAMSMAILPADVAAVITPIQSDTSVTNQPPSPHPIGVQVDPTRLVVQRTNVDRTGNPLSKEFVSNALLAFPLSMLPAGTVGADVEKATMYLWISSVRAPTGPHGELNHNVMEFATVTSAWDEGTDTKPSVGTVFGSLDVNTLVEGQYIVVDLTPQVRGWLDAGSNFGIVVQPDNVKSQPSDFEVSISPRESADHPPIVDITLAGHGSGTAATVTVGTTTTGAPGTAAMVTNRGTSSAAVLDFTIPRGDKGPAGPAGAPGAPGTAATIAVGTTTTGAPGSPAAVANAGTASAAVLDFMIPQGAAGMPGAPGSAGTPGADGKTIRSGPANPAPADGVDGDFYINTATSVLFGPKALGSWPATGVSLVGPAGPPSTYSIAVDINNNRVPFGFHQLLGSYTVTNSEGIVAKVGSYTNIRMKKPGEQVERQVIVIMGGSEQLFFPTEDCQGSTGYVSGSSLLFNESNGMMTLDAAAPVNTEVSLSFWRYDLTTTPTADFQPLSVLNANGNCFTPFEGGAPIAKIKSALTLVQGASVKFLNALWPVTP